MLPGQWLSSSSPLRMRLVTERGCPHLDCQRRCALASDDVFVRTSTRRNSAGVPVRYLQLVHNRWDPVAGAAKMQVLHSFGREDALDRAAIERLIASLSRLLDPAAALKATGPAAAAELAFVSARPLGPTWALDGVWRSLGVDALLPGLLPATRRDARTERVIFGLVAARAIEPGSKLAT